MFVQYECGCIGFAHDQNGDAIIVKCCDADGGNNVSFYRRSMKRNNGEVRPSTPLTEVDEGELITSIQRAISNGHKYCEIRSLLRQFFFKSINTVDSIGVSECGNTWLSSESGGHYILIGLNINDNDSEASQFLEITILPENYPGLNVCTVTEYVKNIIDHIQECYEGWNCRKWNLSVKAPINENGEIVGESVKELQFTCPNCKNHSLEEIMSNVSVASEISVIRSDGDIDYGEQNNEDGNVSQYQCMNCGYVIGQDEKELITDHIDMVNWIKSHCPQED